MKVSVIIPVYNECQTVVECVRNVLAVETADEILLVDDGSTDGTRAL
ncbi:MAG: glycosyltransferase, partial [Anaerolineales bacterium]|nr:glycosyltransferase [Anaerolineales bacterium]